MKLTESCTGYGKHISNQPISIFKKPNCQQATRGLFITHGVTLGADHLLMLPSRVGHSRIIWPLHVSLFNKSYVILSKCNLLCSELLYSL